MNRRNFLQSTGAICAGGIHKINTGLCRRITDGRQVADLRGHHEGRSIEAKWSNSHLAAGRADS